MEIVKNFAHDGASVMDDEKLPVFPRARAKNSQVLKLFA